MNAKLVECLEVCSGNNCLNCDKIHIDDIENCPCNKKCPGQFQKVYSIKIEFFKGGCPCEHFDCELLNPLAESCLNLSSNENYQFCLGEAKHDLNVCIGHCDDQSCATECTDQFNKMLENCPCSSNCRGSLEKVPLQK